MSGRDRAEIARRAALDVVDGDVVNLGIGLPELVADHLPDEVEVILHSENGILGMGPRPAKGAEDMELINAGKKPVTLVTGGSFFHHADSFAMIRGGHVDVCILGAFEVSCAGDLANWSTGDDGIPAVGGAMDLAAGAKSIRVITSHVTREGRPKLVAKLSLPATGTAVVDRIYTELGTFVPEGNAFRTLELAEGCDHACVARLTGAKLIPVDGTIRDEEGRICS